ncbi:hypothetical protein QL285_088115 [Trifolium repens]|nr:hypothetical protein QL285_088115 [Trifolium repens]
MCISICLVQRLTLLNASLEGENAIQKFANMFGFHFQNQFNRENAILLEAAIPSFCVWLNAILPQIDLNYLFCPFNNMAICHLYGCLWPPVFSQQQCKSS